MFRYTKTIHKFFKLGATNKILLTHLLLSATLRTATFLILPFIASEIVNYATVADYHTALIYVGVFGATAFGYIICRHYNHWAYYKNANYIHNRLQEKILEKVSTLPANYSEDISRATIISTAFRDVDNCRKIPDLSFDCISCFISIFISAIILLFVNLLFGVISVACIFISMIFFISHMYRRDRYNSTQVEHQDSLADFYTQIIDGHKEVHSFNMKSDLREFFNNILKSWRKAYLKKRTHQDLADSAVPVFLGIGRITIYLIAAYLILRGEATIATLVLITGYYEDMIDNYNKTTDTIHELSKSVVAINRLYKFLNYKNPNMQKFGSDNTDDISGKVEFRKVNFAYDRKNRMKDLSFTIEPHTFTAIVGKSGSGKSTIFRLLLRLYKPTRGRILIDDKDISTYTKEVYATNVSIVTQKPFVFDMTIRENLNLIDNNHEHQVAACKAVGVHDDIMRLKNGYNTKLISDGSNLSAGQKQLLALARTLLSKSEILLFDEVTSSLNDNASVEVAKVLKKLGKTHTVIMITHKPELMREADDIIVIDHGTIAARGSHNELIKSTPLYKTLQK